MNKDTIESVYNMIASGDPEMQELGVTMFCGATNLYSDYWELRGYFKGYAGSMPPSIKKCFDRIYDNVDPMSINPHYSIKKSEYLAEKQAKLGRESIIKQSCVFQTKEEQTEELKRKIYEGGKK